MFSTAWAMLSLKKPMMVAAFAQAVASAAPAHPPLVVAPRDSVRLLRRARSAQSDFELFHRSNLPITDAGASGSCEIRVGRFCYWADDGDTTAPPAEPARVVRARDRLVGVLDSIGAALPGDDWIAGQRIRYRVDAGRADDAVIAARACRASTWWCHALLGYALHARGDYAAADSVYGLALAGMPEKERCRWTDVSASLDDDLSDRYQKLSCAARDSLARRIRWLAAPLYLVGTHDLRTEHLARFTRTVMEEKARSPQIVWEDDVRELVMRYGWSTWYTKSQPPMGSMREPAVTGHDPSPSFYFLPRAAAVDSPFTVRDDEWQFRLRTAPTRYAPPYLRFIDTLPAQIAALRRGDSAIVIAATDIAADTLVAGRRPTTGLFVWTDPGHEWHAIKDSTAGVQVLTLTVPWQPIVIGLEAMSRESRRAARTRAGRALGLRSGIMSSDLLLYTPGDSAPTALDDVLPRLLPNLHVDSRRPLGIYWELSGVPARGVAVSTTVTIQRIDVGWMHRAAESLHLVGRDSPMSMTWMEVPGRVGGVVSRGVAVDLSHLATGRYRIQLTATPEGSSPVISTRDIDVVR